MRKLLAAFAASSLLILGACGGDDAEVDTAAEEETSEPAGDTLTKEQFIEEGDTLCAALEMASSQAEPPKDETDFGRFLAELAGQGEEASRQFAELNAPEDGIEVQDELVTALDNAVETLKGAAEAAQSGDTVTAEDLARQAGEEGRAADEAARDYGFQVCGAEKVEGDGSDSGAGAEGEAEAEAGTEAGTEE